MKRRLEIVAVVVLCAAFIRLAWAVIGVHVMTTARRHHVESAWFTMSAAALVAVLLTRRALPPPKSSGQDEQEKQEKQEKLAAALLIAAGFTLYWPALSVGLLSDDFVLLGKPLVGQWEFMRPLPLLLWRAVYPLTGPPGLHVLNVALHAINTVLVWKLAGNIAARSSSTVTRWIAAGVFIAFPAAVEPVVWASGIFDVLSVTLILSYIILSLRPGHKSMALALGALCGALVTKETAVVAPALGVLIVGRPRINTLVLTLSIVCVVGYAGVRLYFVPMEGPLPTKLEGYFFKELLGRPFASLLLPWARTELLDHPLVFAVLPQLVVAALLAAYAVRGCGTAILKHAVWVVVAAAPVFGYFYVSDWLEGSRYLYLPLVGWALLLSSLVHPQLAPAFHTIARISLAALLIISVVGVRMHLRPWMQAARVRDAVLFQARLSHDRLGCAVSQFRDVPEVLEGAYVFRNGFTNAVGRPTTSNEYEASPPACVFTWSDGRFESSK